MTGGADRPTGAGDVDERPIEVHWDELVTAALLGTDRRDPPVVGGALADLVADTARAAPSQRMLAQVAACVAVRRAGVVPGPVCSPLSPPPSDDRPVCIPAAAERWAHITSSWPVLEDEWMLTLIGNGWRVAPELVPAMLWRHRRDPVRHARVAIAAGPIAAWLLEHLPDLGGARSPGEVPPEALVELPELPIPAELARLASLSGAESGRALATAIEAGTFAAPHRAVMVNLIARLPTAALADVADVLAAVDPMAPGHGLASALADLATTRVRSLDELDPQRRNPV